MFRSGAPKHVYYTNSLLIMRSLLLTLILEPTCNIVLHFNCRKQDSTTMQNSTCCCKVNAYPMFENDKRWRMWKGNFLVLILSTFACRTVELLYKIKVSEVYCNASDCPIIRLFISYTNTFLLKQSIIVSDISGGFFVLFFFSFYLMQTEWDFSFSSLH